jgi:hypothetical protein
MALLDKCMYCPKEVCHRASELPICDDCSGVNERKRAEILRWNGLSLEEKVEELRNRMEQLENRSDPYGLIG